MVCVKVFYFFFSSRRRHPRYWRDWSSDVCYSDLRIASVGASIGVAIADADTRDADALVRQADSAMYSAKRQGGNAARVHRPGLDSDDDSPEDPAEELARAVCDGELSVVYQPLIDLRSGRPTGAEALVRWDHPRGTRMPDSFIGLAEDRKSTRLN